MLENQSLMASPNDNDNVGKQKKGYARLLYVAVSTAILLLALVLYTNGDAIPIGDRCLIDDNDCVIPPGLTHGVCIGTGVNPAPMNGVGGGAIYGKCQSGQSGSLCRATDDCVVQTGLMPPHAVCRRGKCQRLVQCTICII